MQLDYKIKCYDKRRGASVIFHTISSLIIQLKVFFCSRTNIQFSVAHEFFLQNVFIGYTLMSL